MMRIDSHHHLWDQGVRPQSWMDSATLDRIRGPYTLEDWSAVAGPSGIHHGVFIQTVPDPAETPEVLALADGHPELAAVVGWIDVEHDTLSPGDQLDALLAGRGGSRLAGVRVAAEHPSVADWLDSPAVHAATEALGARNLTLDLLMHPEHLDAAARLATAHPGTRFVVDHLAKPTMRPEDSAAWFDGFEAFGPLAHVACKLSGFLTFDASPMTADRLSPFFQAALRAFGPARMMFGSDWPVNILGGGYAAAVEITEELISPLGVRDQEQIWSGTARRWYPALESALFTTTTQ